MNNKYSRKKTTVNNLLFYYAQIILSIVKGFILIPIYLQFIDKSLFGFWLASGSIIMWVTLFDPGIGDILQQRVAYHYGRSEKAIIKKLISSGVFVGFIVFILSLIVGLYASNYLDSILNINSNKNYLELHSAFNLAVIGSSFILFSYAVIGINRGLQDSIVNNSIDIFSTILGIILTIILLYDGKGLNAIGWGTLLKGFGYLFGNTIYLFWRIIKEKISIEFDLKYLLSFSKIFSFTLMSRLSSTIVNNIDLVIISRFISPEVVTMFELTRRPMKTINGFLSRPSVAFSPTISHLYGEKDLNKLKKVVIRFFYIFFIIIYVTFFGFIIFNKNLIDLWVGSEFYIGNTINIIIGVTFLISTSVYSLSIFTFSLGNIKGNSIIDIIKGALYIVLLYILGSNFGLIGLVLATLLSSIFTEIIYYPKKFVHLLGLNKEEILSLLFLNMKLLFISLLLSGLFSYMHTSTWISLVLNSGGYVFLFVFICFISIKSFRKEFILSINLVKNKIWG